MDKFGKFCMFCVMFVVSALINGAAFSCLWGWFVVAKFGLPELSLMEAYGLSLTVGMVAIGTTKPDDDSDVNKVLLQGFLMTVSRAAILVAAGWIAVQFV